MQKMKVTTSLLTAKRLRGGVQLLVMGAIAAFSPLAAQAAEDLTVAEGDTLTISENATYGTMKIYGSLTIAPGVTVTASNVVYDLPASSGSEGKVYLKEGSKLSTSDSWRMSNSGTFHVYFEGGTAAFPQVIRNDNGTNIFEAVNNPIRLEISGTKSPIFYYNTNNPRIRFTGTGGFVRTGTSSQFVNDWHYKSVLVMSYTGPTTLLRGSWNLQGNDFPYTTDLTIGTNAVLGLNGNTGMHYASVNGDGLVHDQDNNSPIIYITGDTDSEISQMNAIGARFVKSGAGTLTISPRDKMKRLDVNGGRVVLQSRANTGYRRYRFKIDEGRGPGTAWDATQLGELYLYEEDGTEVCAERTSPARSDFADGWVECLFDRTAHTKWFSNMKYNSSQSERDSCYVEVVFPRMIRMRSYMWGTAWDCPGRDPSAWRIMGALSSSGWTTIATVTNFAANTARDARAAATNFVVAPPEMVTIPIVALDGGTLELFEKTSLSTTNFSANCCKLTLTNGSTFAWEPQTAKTVCFLNLNGGGTFLKEGSRDVTIWGENSLTGTFRVAGGKVSMRTSRRETRRFYKFVFEKGRWIVNNPEGDYSAVVDRHTIQFGELALYNERGERVSLSANFNSSSLPDNGGNLFDNKTDTSCYNVNIPATPYSISFELKEGLANYITGYRFRPETKWGGVIDKTPGAWKVYAKASSSEAWELIDQQDNAPATSTDGWNSWNGGVPFMFTNTVDNVATLPADCRVQVDGGATLDVAGTATSFANLALDCSAETDATVVGGSLAASGTLALENVPAVGGTYFLPLAFNGTEGLDNARNWSFTIDGAPAPKLRLTALGGRLALCTKGTVLILR